MVKLKQKSESTKKAKKNYAEMTVENFFDDVEEDEEKQVKSIIRKKKGLSKKKKQIKNVASEDSSADEELSDDGKDELKTHKKQLNKLKDTDPEFYSFLENNDRKLLKFDMSDDEDDSKDDDDANKHIPDDELEVPSDEEDFEGDGKESDDEEDADPSKPKSVTLKLLKEWQNNLQADKVKLDAIKLVIQAFNSALVTVANDTESTNAMRVDGSAVFNGVIQICVLHLQSAVYRYLGLAEKSKEAPYKKKKWKKIQSPLRNYFLDLTRLLENITSGHISTVILKHLHQMLPFIPSFGTIVKPILRRLVTLWSSSEETVRIVSFLCILRITRSQPGRHLSIVLKAMYISYVRNSKFVSPSTLPGINFMRRSLIEMFALDLNATYQHSFLYIRQLAIHLRNAVTLQKKDAYQSVYNWQFINSLRLWADLLSLTYNKTQLRPLIYPLVSIITGAIKFIPTAQYFPLRFHCVKILIRLTRDTGVFVPILPYVLEVLNSTAFNKKHTEVFMKPISFTCILRVNKKELASNVFRDEVVENIYGLVLEHMAFESYHIAFPDLALIAIRTLRKYTKTLHNSKHSRKLKQLCDKIDENIRFMENERNKITFSLADTQMIESWESNIRTKGTPLLVFYESWEKTNAVKQKREAVNSDDINDYNLPTIVKRPAKAKNSDDEDDGPVELFPSGSEDEDELELERPPAKKMKKSKSKKPVVDDDDQDQTPADKDDEIDMSNHVDIVEDLDIADWE